MLDYPGVLRKFCNGATHAINCTSDEEVRHQFSHPTIPCLLHSIRLFVLVLFLTTVSYKNVYDVKEQELQNMSC